MINISYTARRILSFMLGMWKQQPFRMEWKVISYVIGHDLDSVCNSSSNRGSGGSSKSNDAFIWQ